MGRLIKSMSWFLLFFFLPAILLVSGKTYAVSSCSGNGGTCQSACNLISEYDAGVMNCSAGSTCCIPYAICNPIVSCANITPAPGYVCWPSAPYGAAANTCSACNGFLDCGPSKTKPVSFIIPCTVDNCNPGNTCIAGSCVTPTFTPSPSPTMSVPTVAPTTPPTSASTSAPTFTPTSGSGATATATPSTTPPTATITTAPSLSCPSGWYFVKQSF